MWNLGARVVYCRISRAFVLRVFLFPPIGFFATFPPRQDGDSHLKLARMRSLMHGVIWLVSLLAGSACDNRSPEVERPPKMLIVVAAPDYQPSLEPWLARRRAQGYAVHLLDPVQLVESRQGSEAVETLCREIARLMHARDEETAAGGLDAGPAGFVLIVGDAPAPMERLDAERLVPAAIQAEKARPSSPHHFVTDNVYGLPDERGVPRLAVEYSRKMLRSPIFR